MKSISLLWCFAVLFVLVITVSVSYAQTDWTKSENPVLAPGAAGEWDDNSLGPFCILFEDTLYRMWYLGHDGANWAIGYATSEDGLIWIKYDDPVTTDPPYAHSDPVLLPGPAGSWEDERIVNPHVLYKDDMYKMWYSGYDGTNSRIGYATSSDGITWTKYENNPVLNNGPTGSWNEGGSSHPCVRFDGSTYHMWFHGWPVPDVPTSIGYATSVDGITWTEYENNPVLVVGNNTWDGQHVESPDVLFDGSTYHMWYHGRNTPNWFRWRIGYASSPDGIEWTKYASNPVLTPSAGSWDSQSVGFPRVILNNADSTFTMYYLGGATDWNGHIGYATAPFDPVGIENDLYHNYPRAFILSQNYPNPFNPKTVIRYALPVTSHLDLSLYNILGQKVATLVNKKQPVGSYRVQWDASGFAGGVYFYRLRTDKGFVETKKLLYLK